MTLWRVSNYASLEGFGGLYAAGRWHHRGRQIVYCSHDPSTALLETLVHLEIDAEDMPGTFHVVKLFVPEEVAVHRLDPERFPADWPTNLVATREMGELWMEESVTALLEVPSVLVPETWNVLLNPSHAQAELVKIVAEYDHPFDLRLI